MNRFFALLLALVFLSGCSEPLRTLIRLNSEQESHHRYIEQQNNKFEALLKDIETDDLELGLSRKKIIARYGEPIYEKQVEGQIRSLYREPLEYNPAKKVYLYFNAQDKLDSFELIEQGDETQIEESETPEDQEVLSEELPE